MTIRTFMLAALFRGAARMLILLVLGFFGTMAVAILIEAWGRK